MVGFESNFKVTVRQMYASKGIVMSALNIQIPSRYVMGWRIEHLSLVSVSEI